MSDTIDGARLTSPAFADGQRLTAGQLSGIQAFHEQARWLHNRSLHDWGVVAGMTVDAPVGGRVATARSGYALDTVGRELVLPEPRTLTVPAVPEASGGGDAVFYLTVSYASDADLPPIPTRPGTRAAAGATRRPEEPIVRWQDPNERAGPGRFRSGLDLVLATVRVRNCQVAGVSQAERRHVEAATQPFLAAGQSVPGATVWEPWQERTAAGRVVYGVQTRIDTTLAGFVGRPTFLASVIGPRILDRLPGAGTAGVFPIDGFVEVHESSPTGFLLRMLLPRGQNVGDANQRFSLNDDRLFGREALPEVLRALERQLRWHVAWIGIEG